MGCVFLVMAAFLSGLTIHQSGDPQTVLRARCAECAVSTLCLIVGTVLTFTGHR